MGVGSPTFTCGCAIVLIGAVAMAAIAAYLMSSATTFGVTLVAATVIGLWAVWNAQRKQSAQAHTQIEPLQREREACLNRLVELEHTLANLTDRL